MVLSKRPFVFQDTFDAQILMARSVKHCINFMEAKEEDVKRLAQLITKATCLIISGSEVMKEARDLFPQHFS